MHPHLTSANVQPQADHATKQISPQTDSVAQIRICGFESDFGIERRIDERTDKHIDKRIETCIGELDQGYIESSFKPSKFNKPNGAIHGHSGSEQDSSDEIPKNHVFENEHLHSKCLSSGDLPPGHYYLSCSYSDRKHDPYFLCLRNYCRTDFGKEGERRFTPYQFP
ncbi:hypothetical protein EG327_009747 [Venturia inaequalis]|uniref:Uncharacterized protein n=1 Tax=Venturia inaequalis TaxID=5025 RepID=A0A8H3UM82_VENIN|nr:hypothetical protein EG327_009747 [Venturia inaequalis]